MQEESITITATNPVFQFSKPVRIALISYTGEGHVKIFDSTRFDVFEAWASQDWNYSHNKEGGVINEALQPLWRGSYTVEGLEADATITITFHDPTPPAKPKFTEAEIEAAKREYLREKQVLGSERLAANPPVLRLHPENDAIDLSTLSEA